MQQSWPRSLIPGLVGGIQISFMELRK